MATGALQNSAIIAVANQKGGVGKTTIVANLGACLAELGHRVLLVDMDPQSHLTAHWAVEPERGVYDVLIAGMPIEHAVARDVFPGVDLLPSSIELAGAELELAGVVGRELILQGRLRPIADRWDFILLDCPPALGLLTVNALAAAYYVFIPVQLEWFALRGLGQLLQSIEVVRERLNPPLEIAGVIATMAKARRVLCAQVLEALREHFGNLLFRTVIRENIRLAEAPSHGQPIVAYAPKSHGAEDFRALAREVVRRIKRRKKGGR